MSGPTITFEIDGQQVDALDASWYKIAPCGCSCGVTLVALPGKYSFPPLLTDADAWASIYQGEAERMRRDKAAGFRVELGLRRDVVKRLEACRHRPKYGVPTPVTPEGYVWASVHASTRSHLVLGVKNRGARYVHGATFNEAWDAGKVAALCGKTDYMWSAESSRPTCRRCESKAATR